MSTFTIHLVSLLDQVYLTPDQRLIQSLPESSQWSLFIDYHAVGSRDCLIVVVFVLYVGKVLIVFVIQRRNGKVRQLFSVSFLRTACHALHHNAHGFTLTDGRCLKIALPLVL